MTKLIERLRKQCCKYNANVRNASVKNAEKRNQKQKPCMAIISYKCK